MSLTHLPAVIGQADHLPMLTKTGAVIVCPWCPSVLRVRGKDFNVRCRCTNCGRRFRVVYAGHDLIPFDCPSCLHKLETDAGMAGRVIDCPDCEGRITVPPDRVLVQRCRGRAIQSNLNAAGSGGISEIVAVVVGTLAVSTLLGHLWGHYGGTCLICGTHLRNPTPICSYCQQLFGLR